MDPPRSAVSNARSRALVGAAKAAAAQPSNSAWFRHPDTDPIAALTANEIDPITDALRALIGRHP